MKPEPSSKVTVAIYFIGVIGSFLIVAGLIWIMYYFTQPAPVGQERVTLRKKNLTEYKATTAEALNNYGWVDPTRGIVRLPIDQAIDVAAQLWQAPAAGRSNLLARLEKATAPLPKPPEKKSEF